MALCAEEQSNLLSEVHISLLKAVIRAEEKEGTQFGPVDTKDSINCLFYFMDSLTWPESLRSYLSCDPVNNREPLQIFEKFPEYPSCPGPASGDGDLKGQSKRAEDEDESVSASALAEEVRVQSRLAMLTFLANQFLAANAVREDITSEGARPVEEHCRACHRLGDLIACAVCAGAYHPACLEASFSVNGGAPWNGDEWMCHVCKANQVPGVVEELEMGGSRKECLGCDREGNRYWFVCRRLIIEPNLTEVVKIEPAEEATEEKLAEDKIKEDEDMKGIKCKVRYYTSVKQLEEVMESLDGEVYERDLVDTLESLMPEIRHLMALTERLTIERKPHSKKTYLEVENGKISIIIL